MSVCVCLCVCGHTCMYMFHRAKGQEKLSANKRQWRRKNERKKNSSAQKTISSFFCKPNSLDNWGSTGNSYSIFSAFSGNLHLAVDIKCCKANYCLFLGYKWHSILSEWFWASPKAGKHPLPVSPQSLCYRRSTIGGIIQKTREPKRLGMCCVIIIIFPVASLSFLTFCLGSSIFHFLAHTVWEEERES